MFFYVKFENMCERKTEYVWDQIIKEREVVVFCITIKLS